MPRLSAALVGLLLIVLGLTATACSDLQHRRLLRSTEFSPGEFVVDVPVDTRKGLLVVQGRLGPMGERVSMMVDTGAFESKLTAATAQSAGIEPILHRDNSDTFGRSRSMPVGVIPELQFESLAVRQLSAGLLDWPDSAITPCLAPDGLLGANALRGLSWSVEFAAPRLRLSSDGAALGIPADAEPIDIEMPALSATPRLTVAVNGREVDDLLLDLGSNGGLVLPRRYLEELAIPRSRQVLIDDAASSGIYGAARQRSVRAPVSLRIGGLPAVEVTAEFTDDSGAKLGTVVLSHFRLWLNHDEARLYVRPADQAPGFAERVLPHGVLLGVDWASDRWEVNYLEYPAGGRAPAQLAVGEQFDTVNGKRPGEVFAGWCDYVAGVRDWLEAQDALELVDLRTGDRRRLPALSMGPADQLD